MATVREYIDAKLRRFGLELEEVEMGILLEGVGADENTSLNATTLVQAKTALVNIIPELLLLPSKVTEGGFSIERNAEAIGSYYEALCAELGLPNKLIPAQPTVRDASSLW